MRCHRGHPRRFGTKKALDYLIGEKLFAFVEAAEQDSEFARELPGFVAAIQRLFSAAEIRAYRPPGAHEVSGSARIGDRDGGRGGRCERPTLAGQPRLDAQELLRFSRIRQLLQP